MDFFRRYLNMRKKKSNKIKRCVKHYSFVYTKSKKKELIKIAKTYAKVRDSIYNKYSGIEGLRYLSYPRILRDMWVKEGTMKNCGLQARQWKMALDESLSTIKGLWEKSFTSVRSKAMSNKKFSQTDKHYINYVLCSYDRVYNVLKNRESPIDKKFKGTDTKALNRWLHRHLRKAKVSKPKSKSLTFTLDSSMFDLKKDTKDRTWIGISSLVPRKRIKVLLTDDKITTKNIKVKILKTRIEFHQTKEQICADRSNKTANTISLDKGVTTLIHTSKSPEDKFGEGFGEDLSKISDKETDKYRKRNKLKALYKKYSKDPKYNKKAKNILKYNLGDKKINKQKEIDKKRLKDRVNLALNEFFKSNDFKTVVVESLKFQSWKKKLKKRQKRIFSRWLKGYLSDRLKFKCQQNGVLLAEVNPAYTSQTCPSCGYVRRDNRHGDKFHCLSCGKEGDADYFASLNLLSRFKDPDIGLYTPYLDVYKILMSRFNRSVETVQPGLQTRRVVDKPFRACRSLPRHSESVLLSGVV